MHDARLGRRDVDVPFEQKARCGREGRARIVRLIGCGFSVNVELELGGRSGHVARQECEPVHLFVSPAPNALVSCRSPGRPSSRASTKQDDSRSSPSPRIPIIPNAALKRSITSSLPFNSNLRSAFSWRSTSISSSRDDSTLIVLPPDWREPDAVRSALILVVLLVVLLPLPVPSGYVVSCLPTNRPRTGRR